MIRISIITTLVITTSLLYVPEVSAKTTLAVPFSAQAPYKQWIEPWKNACEETVITMINAFYTGDTDLSPAIAVNKISNIFELKHSLFGQSLDENAEKMVTIINSYLPWEARVVENPTLLMLKQEIDEGRPIILPADGKALNNPNFVQGGPPYHTIVLSGYDDAKQVFITQEPGTQFGKDFAYSYNTIMDAMHDFLPNGNTPNGKKVALFTTKNITQRSSNIDADNDGLTKAEEMLIGTNLTNNDTDDDGFLDGEEYKNGYSPLVNEQSLGQWSLIKSANDPKVYLIIANRKHHIASTKIFKDHGWQWSDIITVSEKYLSEIITGEQIKS